MRGRVVLCGYVVFVVVGVVGLGGANSRVVVVLWGLGRGLGRWWFVVGFRRFFLVLVFCGFFVLVVFVLVLVVVVFLGSLGLRSLGLVVLVGISCAVRFAGDGAGLVG